MARFTHPAFGNTDGLTTTINNFNTTWSGTGLAYTGNPIITSAYIKIGNLVTTQYDISCATVTNFGTGPYSLTLPFQSKYHTDVYGGSVHDVGNSNTEHFSIKGHLLDNSNIVTIWSVGSSAKDEPFDHNSPFVLTTADKFHMSFSYISV
jgi:hypothetical protein